MRCIAWDTRLEQWVALKENALATPEARTQFECEAKILARLHHNNRPKVFDHFVTHDGLQYLPQAAEARQTIARLESLLDSQMPAMGFTGDDRLELAFLHDRMHIAQDLGDHPTAYKFGQRRLAGRRDR